QTKFFFFFFFFPGIFLIGSAIAAGVMLKYVLAM
ncbi:hypothetical protein K803_16066, partial [Salmonella enterica subsp. enterica serovar Newport str. SHSN013]